MIASSQSPSCGLGSLLTPITRISLCDPPHTSDEGFIFLT